MNMRISSENEHPLELMEIFDAQPARLYDAFTRPEILSSWFTRNAVADLQEGGVYSNADLDFGIFLKLDRPEHLCFSWENKNHCPNTIVDIQFKPLANNRTEVRLQHLGIDNRNGQADMIVSWKWAFASLKSFLKTGKPIAFESWQSSDSGE